MAAGATRAAAAAALAADRVPLLALPHMAPLEALRAEIVAAGHPDVPHADPRDGGAAAQLLILLETPGPGTAPPRFVSRDNPTGTAANLRRFLAAAGIARGDVLVWNAVPWVIHAPGARNRAPRRDEVAEGLRWLPPLIARLPGLNAALLMGRVAGEAAPLLAPLPAIPVPHPSPTIVCTSPAIPARIAAGIAEVAALLRRDQAAACCSSHAG